MSTRFYFSQKGSVWSLNKAQAIALCERAISTGQWNFNRFKEIGVRAGLSTKVFNCDTFSKTDWQECLSQVGGIKK